MAQGNSFCYRCFILFFHVLCTVAAVFALAIGVYVYLNSYSYSQGIQNCAIPLIAVGVLVTCIHTCCCWTVNKTESTCYRVTFLIIIFVIAAFLLILAALTYFVKDEALNVLKDTIEKKFKEATDGDKEAWTFVNTFQKYGKCCGTYGPTFWTLHWIIPPESCCSKISGDSKIPCILSGAYEDGCQAKALSIFSFFIYSIIVAVIVIAVLEIISGFITFHDMKRRRSGAFRSRVMYTQGRIHI